MGRGFRGRTYGIPLWEEGASPLPVPSPEAWGPGNGPGFAIFFA